MNRTITALWSVMLIVTTVGVVPVVVGLLQRALTAARNIERYTAEALASGVEIAENTASVAKLQDTISVAGGLLTGAEAIAGHTAAVESALVGSKSAVEQERQP